MRNTAYGNVVIAICLVVLTVFVLIMALGHIDMILNTPPEVTAVKEQFNNYYDSIQVVVDFMINSNYENIYILDDSGIIQADFKDIYVKDSVNKAIKQLLNGKYSSINKIGNTIWLLQWRGAQDIGCGLAYSINGTELPEVDFMTDLVPISENGWYYYISDYNSWGQGDGSVVPYGN